MKILLGNTGRGGEQCIFSSIVEAYKTKYQKAQITIAICPEYVPLWQNSGNIIYQLTHQNKDEPFYKDPVGHWTHITNEQHNYDIIEFACEYGVATAHPAIANIYNRLKTKPCQLSDIERVVRFYPNHDHVEEADHILNKYGSDLLIISNTSCSAAPVLSPKGYADIAKEMMKYGPVACTGRLNKPGPFGSKTDEYIPGTIDLRGIPLLTLYALSFKLMRFIGPDTATSWLVANMPGKLMTVRGDATYPITNTGLSSNGFRSSNTLELDVIGLPITSVIDRCIGFF